MDIIKLLRNAVNVLENILLELFYEILDEICRLLFSYINQRCCER